jgi:hypothetical protein
MEITLCKHKISIYGTLLHWIFRLYDAKGYVFLTISTIRNTQFGIHKSNRRFNGEWK